MEIRAEQESDYAAIKAVNEAAFGSMEEAGLVEMLRKQISPLISLVADIGEKIVGHILFSPVELTGYPQLNIMGLAPMAVLPNYQNQGIGSQLVSAGLKQCEDLGVGAVVVLGHARYYPRFGFKPSSQFGIECEYDVPEELFMIKELKPGYLQGATGVIKYHDAFSNY